MRMSYRTLIWVVCIAVMGFATYRWIEAGEEPAAKAVSSVTLQELLDRVQKLETRVDQLEGRPLTLFPAHGLLPRYGNVPYSHSPSYPPGTEFPNGWQQREINGIRYYLVPLDSAAGKGPK